VGVVGDVKVGVELSRAMRRIYYTLIQDGAFVDSRYRLIDL
jgi:hypothetical protein